MLKFLSIGIIVIFLIVLFLFRKKLPPLFRFFKSKLFIINLLFAIIALFLIPYFTLNYLNDYTNHGVNIAVPNFIGSDINTAENIAHDNNINIIISDSVFSDEFPKGTVIRQDPKPNTDNYKSYVKPNRKIYLTVVKQAGEYKEIPDLTGDFRVSKKIAKVRLEMLGFKTSFSSVPSKDNYVVELRHKGRKLKAGDKILKGETIEVVHGAGTGGIPVTLPDVEGRTVADALNILSLANLNVEVNYEGENISADDSLNFVVKIQSPHPRILPKNLIESGSTVTLIAEEGIPFASDSTAIDTTSTQ